MSYRFSQEEKARLEAVRCYIEEHLREDLRLGPLCRKALMNRQRLNRGFVVCYGKKVMDYIRSVRMAKARELLVHTDWPLDAIARAIGYGHTSNFMIAYKKYYDRTAGAERRE